MDISPPFGYRSVVTLLREQRVRLPAQGDLPAFALNSNSLPLTYSEISPAGRDYPVIFVQLPNGDFTIVGVLGVDREENLFINNNTWESGTYVPAYIRRYPFCMTRVINSDDNKVDPERLVCVESDFVSEDGVVLVDADGKGTEQWETIFLFIQEFESDLERTQEFCSILAKYKLLQPFAMQADLTHGGRVNLDGMFCVNESLLENLTSNEIRTLIRKGAMRGIYQHLGSLARFNLILERKAQRNAALGLPATPLPTTAVAANEPVA